jgi:hypothetical protein
MDSTCPINHRQCPASGFSGTFSFCPTITVFTILEPEQGNFVSRGSSDDDSVDSDRCGI